MELCFEKISWELGRGQEEGQTQEEPMKREIGGVRWYKGNRQPHGDLATQKQNEPRKSWLVCNELDFTEGVQKMLHLC